MKSRCHHDPDSYLIVLSYSGKSCLECFIDGLKPSALYAERSAALSSIASIFFDASASREAYHLLMRSPQLLTQLIDSLTGLPPAFWWRLTIADILGLGDSIFIQKACSGLFSLTS